MSYYQKTDVEKITLSNIPKRIKNLLTEEDINSWERNFLISIENFFKNKEFLTEKQYKLLKKIETRFSKEAKECRERWKNKFSKKEKNEFKICCEYYSPTGYYKHITSKWKKDLNYIPTAEEFEKICRNKYAKKIIDAQNKNPKFKTEELVEIRKTIPRIFQASEWFKSGLKFNLAPGTKVIVIQNDGIPYISASNGCRVYSVLPLGAVKTFQVEERWLKKYRRKK